MSEAMSLERALAVLERIRAPSLAQLVASTAGNSLPVWVQTFPLTTARTLQEGFRIGRPFTSMTVVSATDANTNINMQVDTVNASNDPFNVKPPATLDFPLPVKEAYLYWDAQAGKTITIAFFLYGSFKTNQTNLSISGGLNTSFGSSCTLTAPAMLATEVAIFPLDLTRKNGEFRNTGTEPLYVGPTGVLTTTGRIVDVNDDFEWMNTAALYGIAATGGFTLQCLNQF